ncbi:MAG: helix-turn-helix domain-containing protein [Methylocella sp.]
MSKFGQELIGSAAEALAIAKGIKKAPLRLDAEAINVAVIRKRLNLSQARFAETFGLSAATVRDWEQGRRQPDRTARALLTVIARRPEVVMAALAERGPAARRATGR